MHNADIETILAITRIGRRHPPRPAILWGAICVLAAGADHHLRPAARRWGGGRHSPHTGLSHTDSGDVLEVLYMAARKLIGRR